MTRATAATLRQALAFQAPDPMDDDVLACWWAVRLMSERTAEGREVVVAQIPPRVVVLATQMAQAMLAERIARLDARRRADAVLTAPLSWRRTVRAMVWSLSRQAHGLA